MDINKEKLRELLQLVLMIFLSVITQAITLVKSSLLASTFGASADIDAYNVVLNITTFVFSFLATGITTILIPAYIRKVKNEAINTFLTVIYVASLCIAIVILLLQNTIFDFFSNGNEIFVETAKTIILIMLVSQFFNTYLGVTTAYFQCQSKYNIPKICALGSSILLVTLMFVTNEMTILRLAIYTGSVTLIDVSVQSMLARKYGKKNSISFNIKLQEFKEMFHSYLPTVFSAGLYQLNLLMDSLISARTGEGNVTIMSYANSIINMISSLLIANLLIYMYPKLAYAISANVKKGKTSLYHCIYIMNMIVGVMLICFFVLGQDVLSLLLHHGHFNHDNLLMVYYCTCLYMVIFPFNVTRDLFYRFFYANGNTKATFYNSVIVSIINLVVSIALALCVGLYGIILGTLISAMCSLLMITIRYEKKYGFDGEKSVFLIENIKIYIFPIIVMGISMAYHLIYGKLNFIVNIITCFIVVLLYIIYLIITKTTVLYFINNLRKERKK